MERITKLTAKEILNKKFSKDVKGYDASEVDEFLDQIIADYEALTLSIGEKDAKINALENEIRSISPEFDSSKEKMKAMGERVKELELENASLKNKLDGIKPGDKVNAENLEWIQRCRKLEKLLYQQGLTDADIR